MITAKTIEADPLGADGHQVAAMTLADVRDILAKLVSPEAKLQISAINTVARHRPAHRMISQLIPPASVST